MKSWDTVAIVGVGLIGGSIGIDLLRRKLARRVVGIGRRPASLRTAKRVGAISSSTLDLAKGVADADLILVCTPVGRVVEDVMATAAACPPKALITDAGSTKATIVDAIDRSLPADRRFVGSHPLAGSEQTGPAAAVAGLFQKRTVVVTPTDRSAPRDVASIERFWKSLGARVLRMPADEHDRLVAGSSHLPHLVASALSAATPKDCLPLVAGGWSDTTRIAAGDPTLWRQIFETNREHVLAALARYEEVLASLGKSLARQDGASLERILTEAKQKRDALGS